MMPSGRLWKVRQFSLVTCSYVFVILCVRDFAEDFHAVKLLSLLNTSIAVTEDRILKLVMVVIALVSESCNLA